MELQHSEQNKIIGFETEISNYSSLFVHFIGGRGNSVIKVIKLKIYNLFFSKKDYTNIDMHSLYYSVRENKVCFFHQRNKTNPIILLFGSGSENTIDAIQKIE